MSSKYKLIHGDCILEMDALIEKKIKVDCVCVDLPYGQTQSALDKQLPLEQLWERWKLLVKDGGAVILFGQGMFTAELMMSNRKWWRYNLVWDKSPLVTGHLNARRAPMRCHEDICIFASKQSTYNPQMKIGKPLHSKGKSYTSKEIVNRNYGKFQHTDDSRAGSTLKYPKSIWRFPKVHPSKAIHQTEKSIPLLEELIKTYTNPGETVLDCCMGSCTCGVAALNTGRNFIGIELNKEYFDISERRLETWKP